MAQDEPIKNNISSPVLYVIKQDEKFGLKTPVKSCLLFGVVSVPLGNRYEVIFINKILFANYINDIFR